MLRKSPNRRSFLSALGSIPFIGGILPAAAVSPLRQQVVQARRNGEGGADLPGAAGVARQPGRGRQGQWVHELHRRLWCLLVLRRHCTPIIPVVP